MRRSGFMLIELAVATFVIGVAVLALAAIIHLGQRAGTDSDATTRAALFADDALSTLRLMNDRAATDPDREAWCKLWAKLDPDSDEWASGISWTNPERIDSGGTIITQLTGFASEVWVPDQSHTLSDKARALPHLDTSYGVHTNFWCPARVRSEGHEANSVRADFSLRYALSIAPSEEKEDSGLGYDQPRYFSVTLHVWSGTSLASESSDTTFFAVFSNQRRMP